MSELDKQCAEALGWVLDEKPYIPEHDAYATATYFRDEKGWIAAENWQPTKNLNQAMELLEGLDWLMRKHADGTTAVWLDVTIDHGELTDYEAEGYGRAPAEAICAAFINYKHIGEKK